MAFATIGDFEVRHGALADEDAERIEALLADASSLILSALQGATELWVIDGDEIPSAVVGICVSIAYRAWSNPDALSSASLGEHAQAWADRSGQALRITDDERRIVRLLAGIGSFRSVTLESPYAGPLTDDEPLP